MLTVQYWIPRLPRSLQHEDTAGTSVTEHPPAAMIAMVHCGSGTCLGAAIALWAFQGSTSHLKASLGSLGTT